MICGAQCWCCLERSYINTTSAMPYFTVGVTVPSFAFLMNLGAVAKGLHLCNVVLHCAYIYIYIACMSMYVLQLASVNPQLVIANVARLIWIPSKSDCPSACDMHPLDAGIWKINIDQHR